ncbi:bifunctional folylpolyglutamate synthase/dihydrofolate synthase [Acanthopleuribacter pedis]|uniref:Bifunctional folylpolyglutamate synthase/dihydrofolate synthase n=1 Tax=Acanthopleuribacter pedis TaxID=442870 RepID=A0A8J7QNW6_9BACT|nr:hypothetical protein [Acanthopleuribacter pedis]MBO1321908.1 hypothetical protein [Acanthopleuribacter pedis]
MSHNPWPPTLLTLLKQLPRHKKQPPCLQARFPALIRAYQPDLDDMHIVKVAGTNGKGSTCAMLAACLNHKQGIGLFTSPHLVSPCERFRLHGKQVSFDDLEAASQRVATFLADQAPLGLVPTFFEVLILMALDLFRSGGVRLAIFEAGVGGYNDSVHLLPGDLAAVTTVGLDHMDRLGNTAAAIARDKAGICPAGGTLVLGPGLTPSVRQTIRRETQPRGITLIDAATTDLGAVAHQIPFAGAHQRDNAKTALCLAQLIAKRHQIPCFPGDVANATLGGRLESRRFEGRSLLLDVAHNPAALEVLRGYLDAWIPYEQRFLVYGAAEDKDYQACLTHLRDLAPRGFLVGGFYRAAAPTDLARALPDNFQPRATPAAALGDLPKHDPTTVVVCGSVFLVGAVSEHLSTSG